MSPKKNWKRWLPTLSVSVVDSKNQPKVGGWVETMRVPKAGRTKCLHCDHWFEKEQMGRHLDEVNKEYDKARKQAEQVDKVNTTPPPTKPAPTANVGKGSKNHTKNTRMPTKEEGREMPYRGQPQHNGSERPAAGIDDGLAQLMGLWSTRLPNDFIVARREAEDMGEAWRSVADAFRRRADAMVEELKVAPDCVEPFHEAAGIASRLADCHMEVANRIAARYEKEIEFVNDPNSPDSEFLTQH